MITLYTDKLKISKSSGQDNHDWIITPRSKENWWYSIAATEKQIRLMFDIY